MGVERGSIRWTLWRSDGDGWQFWDSRGPRELVACRGQLADRIKYGSSSHGSPNPRRNRGDGSGDLVGGPDELVPRPRISTAALFDHEQ